MDLPQYGAKMMQERNNVEKQIRAETRAETGWSMIPYGISAKKR